MGLVQGAEGRTCGVGAEAVGGQTHWNPGREVPPVSLELPFWESACRTPKMLGVSELWGALEWGVERSRECPGRGQE